MKCLLTSGLFRLRVMAEMLTSVNSSSNQLSFQGIWDSGDQTPLVIANQILAAWIGNGVAAPAGKG